VPVSVGMDDKQGDVEKPSKGVLINNHSIKYNQVHRFSPNINTHKHQTPTLSTKDTHDTLHATHDHPHPHTTYINTTSTSHQHHINIYHSTPHTHRHTITQHTITHRHSHTITHTPPFTHHHTPRTPSYTICVALVC
jgi:hypothetical protein